jgi:sugar transferase (PEP-CTERM/EpsH1 system associated)
MRVLYVCQRVPYPPNRGDKIASYNAIRFLAQRHEVIVGCLANSDEELEHAEELRRQGFTVEVAKLSPVRQKWNALTALCTGEPLSVAFFRCKELANLLKERLAATPVDVIITFCSSMGQYAELAPDVPLIADFVDLDSRKWDLYCRFHRWPRRLVYRLESQRLLEYERTLAAKACCTLLRTEAERNDCLRLMPTARVEVLSNGVDLDYFQVSDDDHDAKTGKDIVFTGVMDYFPNVQGVTFFANEVFPIVRQSHPDATFTIVGTHPSREVLALGQLPGVTVTGRQEDIRPFLVRASVAVAPLLLARGIQNKVLEAMSMRLPVVVTPAAFRGVDVDEGDGVFVAEKPTEFAAEVSKLLDDPARARSLGLRARQRVEERYIWDEQLALLESLAEEAVGSFHLDEKCVVDGGND